VPTFQFTSSAGSCVPIHMDANGNPNPSPPFSLSNSSNVADTQRRTVNSSILSRATISAVTEASRGTHRQASVGLDAAYNRLRQIRRGLWDLPESLPVAISPEIQAALSHDADTSPGFPLSSATGRRERFGSREDATPGQIHSAAAQNDRVPSDVPLSESSSRSVDRRQPVRPSLGPPHNTLSTNQNGTSAGHSEDDEMTLLGRRVAARLAVVPTTGAATNHYGGAREVYEGMIDSILSVTRRYEEELEMLGHILGGGRRLPTTGPSRTVSRSSPAFAYLSQDRHHASPHQSLRGASQTPQAPQDFLQNPQRDLGAAINREQNLMPSERLSFLSNFAVQNSPTPSDNVPNRPLIFNEPLRHVPSELNDPSPEPRPHSVSESAFQGRNYVVHRTYNRDGEELVHNITVDWGDRDPLPWLMPSPNTSRRHRNRFSSSGRQDFDVLRTTDPVVPSPSPPPLHAPAPAHTPTSSNDPPRRRGWGKFIFYAQSSA
jgi:hypothetical protein